MRSECPGGSAMRHTEDCEDIIPLPSYIRHLTSHERALRSLSHTDSLFNLMSHRWHRFHRYMNLTVLGCALCSSQRENNQCHQWNLCDLINNPLDSIPDILIREVHQESCMLFHQLQVSQELFTKNWFHLLYRL